MSRSQPTSQIRAKKYHHKPKGVAHRAASVIFRTQNGFFHQSDFIDTSATAVKNHIPYRSRFLSCKYDGLLLRHDLEPRIQQSKQILDQLKSAITSVPEAKTEVDSDEYRQQQEIFFVYDTFDRLETARRAIASQILQERDLLVKAKKRFIQTRAHLHQGSITKIHSACLPYARDFGELEKHRHFLNKEISKIASKIEIAERINRSLLGKVSYVQNYGPMIAEKLQSEEGLLEMMRLQKVKIETRLKELHKGLEAALAAQDRGRDEIQRRRTEMSNSLIASVQALTAGRVHRLHRQQQSDACSEKQEKLTEKLRKLREQATELSVRVDELKSTAASKKSETEILLAQLEEELLETEQVREQHEADEASGLQDASSLSILASKGRKFLSKAQRLELIKIRRARRENKEKKRATKRERQFKASEKVNLLMRSQYKEASDRVAELQRQSMALDPQLERLGFLEDTFQKEFEERTEQKSALQAEVHRKSTELHEAAQKLEAAQREFERTVGAKRRELELARTARSAQEKLLKDLLKEDGRERKRLSLTLTEGLAGSAAAEETTKTRRRALDTVLHNNRELHTELDELTLAIKLAYEFIPTDEAKRRSKELELLQKKEQFEKSLKKQHDRIVDKADLCEQFIKEREFLRQQYCNDVQQLKKLVLHDIQEEKLEYHKAFRCYQTLMFFYRRFLSTRDMLVKYGEDARAADQARVKEMWKRAAEERNGLADAAALNLREFKTFYNLNVTYHVLHIKNTRENVQKYAVLDDYENVMEMAAAKAALDVTMKENEEKRRSHWTWVIQSHKEKVEEDQKTITNTQEHNLQTCDKIWEELKENVIRYQNISLDESMLHLFKGDFRDGWSWSSASTGAGDG